MPTRGDNAESFRSLSIPTYRGSTILYPDYGSFLKRAELGRTAYTYGLGGTPTTRTLASRLTALEGGLETFLVPSGLMAITTAVLALVSQGDRVLFPDSVYAPVRRFAASTLARLGVMVDYYDPLNAGNIDFGDPDLRMIWVESPGSITMEIQDLPLIVEAAHDEGVLVGCDNSWASPYFCKPLLMGVDVVVEAVTKYLSGHSDLLLGSITVSDESLATVIHDAIKSIGIGVSPDDCFLAIRGLESAAVRLAHIERTALHLAEFIEDAGCVAQVFHPALASFPAHELWKRQFTGSSGVFSFIMIDEPEAHHASRYQRLRMLKIGASWGGTHSLIAPSPVDHIRSINKRLAGQRVVRLSVGLESEADLIEDVARFLDG